MNFKSIAVLLAIVILGACNETSNQSTSSKDSTVTSSPDNTTVSPGTPDPAKTGAVDSSMNKTDSLALYKR
jgi:hypothetical protein